MKILAVVDMHGSSKAFKELKKKSPKADLIINAGDFSIFEQKMEEFFDKMSKLKKHLLLIHGNHEIEEDCAKAELFENIEFIHKKEHIIDNYLFLGWGGGGFSRTEKEFDKQAEKWLKKIKKIKPEKLILITHAPPYGTKLDLVYGEHAGNKSIKKFITKAKPDLVICGHLHENSGVKHKISKTLIINPGPYGKYIEI